MYLLPYNSHPLSHPSSPAHMKLTDGVDMMRRQETRRCRDSKHVFQIERAFAKIC